MAASICFYDSFEGYDNFSDDAPQINGAYVFGYTFQLIGDSFEESEYFNLGVFCHEMFHVINATDLYHYYSDDEFSSVGTGISWIRQQLYHHICYFI